MTDRKSLFMTTFCNKLGESKHLTEIPAKALKDIVMAATVARDAVAEHSNTVDDVLPSTLQSILHALKHIPDEVREAIPDPLDEQDRIELAILKTLIAVDRNAELVVTDVVAVPALEHEGPDMQFHHVPCTDVLKGLPEAYWDLVNS